MKLLLIQLSDFKRIDRVPALDHQRAAVDSWLTQWTCANNFKARIGTRNERERMEEELFAEAIDKCNHVGFDARNFRVRLTYNTIEDGKFWINLIGGRAIQFDLADCPNPQPAEIA